MRVNPVLRRLGFADTDRLLIIHADDLGMCQASVAAFAELVEFGLVSSGATMVPCPWFLEMAAYCRAHPRADVGVHGTITSEWRTYRWGPISTRDPASGLVDEEGCFFHRSPEAHDHGDPGAVRRELEAQIDRALAAGIDVTHVDRHMGALGYPKFLAGYVEATTRRRLPPNLLLDEGRYLRAGFDEETANAAVRKLLELEERGVPLFDRLESLPLTQPEGHVEITKQLVDSLEPGLTLLLLHPSIDSPELRSITPNWPSRVANYQAMLSVELRDYVRRSGVQVIGYRPLRELMPKDL